MPTPAPQVITIDVETLMTLNGKIERISAELGQLHHFLMGNGQKGEVQKIREDIEDLKERMTLQSKANEESNKFVSDRVSRLEAWWKAGSYTLHFIYLFAGFLWFMIEKFVPWLTSHAGK